LISRNTTNLIQIRSTTDDASVLREIDILNSQMDSFLASHVVSVYLMDIINKSHARSYNCAAMQHKSQSLSQSGIRAVHFWKKPLY